MSSDRFDIEEPQVERQSSALSGCMKGCLIVGVILLILAAVAVFYVMNNWRGWAADLGSQVVDLVIDESDLPEQEKVEIKEQVSRVVEAFRSGELSGEKLGVVMEEIVESPLFPSIAVAGIERRFFDSSGLTDEEKEAGRVEVKRFVRGMIDKKIPEAAFEEVMPKIADKKPNDQWELKNSVSDEELRDLIQLMKDKADAAEIPAEVDEVDPSDEMKRIIDAALGEAVEGPSLEVDALE